MALNPESDEFALAVSSIRNLTVAKADAEAQIANCIINLTSEEGMLASLIAQPKTASNSEYLKAGKKACRLGIKAWKLSIAAYQNDIETFRLEIEDITKRFPNARMDN